jgi:ankyrin repeat protein
VFTVTGLDDAVALREMLAADPEALERRDPFDRTPVAWAARCGAEATYEVLAAKGVETGWTGPEGDTLLHLAAKGGSAAITAGLLDRGLDMNARGAIGRTPLNVAAEHGHLAAVKVLVERGADVDLGLVSDCGNCDGWTPLLRAVRGGHTEVVEVLLAAGANPELRSHQGGALSVAVVFDRPGLARLLLASGADPNGRPGPGWSGPLCSAVIRTDEAMARMMVEAGADVNRSAPAIGTILHWVAGGGTVEQVSLLLELGADPTIENQDGKTALDVAEESGRDDIAVLLRTHVASVTNNEQRETSNEE